MAQNISAPRVGGDVKEASYNLFKLILQHDLPDPSIAAGEARVQIGKGGQHYEFTDLKPRSTSFQVSGFVHTNDKGEWAVSGSDGGNSNGKGDGISYPSKNSFVHINKGYINGRPAMYEGTQVMDRPHEKFIDSDLFSQKNAIGVALYVKRTRDEWRTNADYRCEIKFHTITKLNMQNARKVKNTQLYDPKWLWQGTRKQGGGVVRDDDKQRWVGDESIGRVLLALITPPPDIRFIQVVTSNLSYGVYNLPSNIHKHTFWK